MNTGKQINVMLGLFMVFAVATLLYFLWDGPRQEEAIERQTTANSERGAELFSLNCRSCHGITGQGPLERGSLPGLPLNLDANRPESAGVLGALQRKFTDTITCGRVGTSMPPWSQDQGGPLNFFQIEQIVTLITGSKPVTAFDPSEDPNAVSESGWEFVWEAANHADEFNPHVEIIEPVGTNDTTIAVNESDPLKEGDILRLGGNAEEPQYELVSVTAIADGEITVDRAVEGTTAMQHADGTEVFGNFVPAGTGITGEMAPVCGQSVRGGGGGGPAAPTVTVEGSADVSMGDNFFEVDGATNPTLEVRTGESITFEIVNDGVAIHNMRIAGVDNAYDSEDDFVSDPDFFIAGDEGTLTFTIDEPGTFNYRCDFHPIDMIGQISVVE
ncbi:MAG: plastocyanin/azurin family copper-binding protein [Dehalococcoidia bacterium]